METEVLKEIKQLGESLNDSDIYKYLISSIKKSESPYFKTGILGGANVGKSRLINLLLSDGEILPESLVSSLTDVHIYPADEKYYVANGEKYTFKHPEEIKYDTGNVAIYLNDKWLLENNLSFSECHELPITGKSTDVELAGALCTNYLYIYILDALMPLNKQDVTILSALNKFQIPTFVLVSKFEKVAEEEQKELKQYLHDKLTKYPYLSYPDEDLTQPFSGLVNSAKKFIESTIKTIDITHYRTGYQTLFISDAVTKLQRLCQSKIEQNRKNKQKIAENTQKKYDKINALETEWMRIESGLSERIHHTTHRIREKLDSKADDMFRRLSHDIEVSNDIKHYWDKELSYRLDEMMRSETQSLLQLINGDIVNTLKWLQDEIIRNFKFQTPPVPFVSVSLDNEEVVLENLKLEDNQKLKIITRVGTAATVISAGVLFATAGVGGIVMAVGMLSGIGAEYFMKHKTKESRQKVLNVLPNIIEKAKLEYVSKITDSLKLVYEEVVKNVKEQHQFWREKQLTDIREEERIATHNLVSTQWDECMNKINELTTKLI